MIHVLFFGDMSQVLCFFMFITKCDGIITNCDSLLYYKVRWTVITNCNSFFITKCDTVYYKLRQVLQSAMDLLQIAKGITKCDDYYKLRQYMVAFSSTLSRFSPATQPLASLCTPLPSFSEGRGTSAHRLLLAKYVN